MIEISLSAIFLVVGFVVVWGVSYLVTLLARFGSDLTWRSESIAATIALLPPVLMFTDVFKFTW